MQVSLAVTTGKLNACDWQHTIGLWLAVLTISFAQCKLHSNRVQDICSGIFREASIFARHLDNENGELD